MRSPARIVALLTACLLLVPAGAASAHGGNPDYLSVLDDVSPRVPGVEFRVLDYDSHYQVLDEHGHEVVIYGYNEEPYARILRDGTVQVNRRSPATYLNEDRFAEVKVPAYADPKAKPQWETIDHSGTFVWHDHRMHYMSPDLPPQVTDESRKTKIFDYAIPISIDGRRGDVNGTLYWVGPANTSKLPFILIGVAIVLGGGLLVSFLRRRRRDEGDDGAADSGAGGTADDAPEPEAW
jgi:hypothetical protein